MNRLYAVLAFGALLGLLLQTLAWNHDNEITTRLCIQHSTRPELCGAHELRTNEGSRAK